MDFFTISLPSKSVVRLADRPDMTLDVYRGRKTTMQQQQQQFLLALIREGSCQLLATVCALSTGLPLRPGKV